MAKQEVITGYTKNDLPYVRIGSNPRKLVIFEGLNPNHRPPSGLSLRMLSSMLKGYTKDFTVYYVGRKPNLPVGYTIRDMSEDYATMIKEELGEPVSIMGISTGGSIAQYFAVDHPDLTCQLVLASNGYRLTEQGKRLQKRVGDLIEQGKWRAAAATLATVMTSGVMKPILQALFWMLGKHAFGSPSSLSDAQVEAKAEDKHDFKENLAEIKMPTLVIGGDKDFFYPISETAAGIQNAKLVLYEGVGHGAMMKRQFSKDVLAFLAEGAV